MDDNAMSSQDYNDVKLKLGLLEKDVQMTGNLLAKVSESIEKIQEMNLNLIKMLTLHEQRHSQHEKVETELKEDIKDLHSRISTQSRQLNERIDQFEKHVTDRLDDIRTDLLEHQKREFPEDHPKDNFADKLEKINEWRWMIIGAIILAAWFIGELDVLGKFLK